MSIFKILITGSITLMALPALADSITCISANDSFARCNLSHADERNVQIANVQSGDCSKANAWGTDSTGIWVNKGCGAVFTYGADITNNTNTETSAPANSNPYYSGYAGPDVVVTPGWTSYEPYYYYGPEGAVVYNNENWNREEWNNDRYHPADNPNVEDFHEEGFRGGGVGVHR